MQDYTKEGDKRVHRFYSQTPQFNYGFIPRTWCDDELGGDGDAIDLIDLSWKELKPVLAVSDYLVLGIMGLVDQGELDYKVIGIEVNEAAERGIKTLDDFHKQQPGRMDEIQVWFRDYKLWEGKKQNEFIWNGQIQSPQRAMDLIHESNHQYLGFWEDPELNKKRKYWIADKPM